MDDVVRLFLKTNRILHTTNAEWSLTYRTHTPHMRASPTMRFKKWWWFFSENKALGIISVY